MALLPGNLLTENQQSIETDIDNWAGFVVSSSSTIRSTTQAHDGSASIRATYNGTPSDVMASLTSTSFAPLVTAGTSYTFSYWVYSPRAVNFAVLVEWWNAANSSYISDGGVLGSTAVPANTWSQVSVSGLVADTGAGTARVYLMCTTGLTTNDLVYFDTIFFGVPVTSPYTLTATGSWTAPDGINAVKVECWAGGGAGGGGRTTSGAGGGGGAGGCYVTSKAYTVIPGNTYTVTVGAAGAHSTGSFTDGSLAGSGGDTWFDSTSGVVAKGGAGGTNKTVSGAGAAGTGSTTGCIGDTSLAGGNGAAGTTSIGGGGGGGAGSTGAGGNASGSTAGTGTSVGGGNGSTGVSAANAAAATAAGGGGGGARASSSTTRTGGDGARGQVVLTWPVAPAAKSANIVGTAVRRASTW